MLRSPVNETFDAPADPNNPTNYICDSTGTTCIFWPLSLNSDGTYSRKPIPKGYVANTNSKTCGGPGTSVTNCNVLIIEPGKVDPATGLSADNFHKVPASQVWTL